MSVTKRDYYEVLGVVRDCDETVLKASYRKLAMAHHPDRNPGDKHAEEKFKEAAEAYSVLSDPQKRAAYDRFGHQGVPAAAGGGFDASGLPDLSDILNEMFGFGDVFDSDRASSAGRARSAAKTSATTWTSVSKIPCAAWPSTSRSPAWKNAGAAKAKAPSPKTASSPAPPAAAAAK